METNAAQPNFLWRILDNPADGHFATHGLRPFCYHDDCRTEYEAARQ